MARVYGLYNYTRRERYYGMTERPLKRRRLEHEAGQTAALSNWNWKKDKVAIRTIAKGLSARKATEKAHELESRKPPPGWKTIQTGGK